MIQTVYQERRRAVLAALDPHSALVIAAAPVAMRNNDVEHAFRQDSDFFYLTGFDEPESVLVLSPGAEAAFTLFVRPRDPERETWDGERAGCEGAVARFGADKAHPIGDLDTELAQLLSGRSAVHYQLGNDAVMDRRVLVAVAAARAKARRGPDYPRRIIEPGCLLHEMRRLKQPAEIDLMDRASEITCDAHIAAMSASGPGVFEYEIEAVLRARFRRAGAERCAYSPIVGSGPNATILHYTRNDRQMTAGDLVLIDAGCEYGYYASDVTRTFPVNGRFSGPQRAIYDIVLDAQCAAIARVRPGATLDSIHQASLRVITEGLVNLGLIEGPVDDAITEERYKPFYMHKTSHYLGMDVHDVGAYFVNSAPRPLEPGVVITVEPGIYISASQQGAAAEYAGIGVRIEDDILVTGDGCRNLSVAAPKSIEDVERACAN